MPKFCAFYFIKIVQIIIAFYHKKILNPILLFWIERKNMNKKNAIILLSGGLDSATCLAVANKEGFVLNALTFDYGQRHKFEIDASKKLAAYFKVQNHLIVKIDPIPLMGSALTSNEISVPKDRCIPEKREIPITYVPARNIIFLSYALAWAENLPSRDIFIGVNAVDFSGYPDCTDNFITAFKQMADVGTRLGAEGNPLNIHTPLIKLSKAEIIKLGISLKVDYSLTHSCYDPSEEGFACGHCDACQLRLKGFKEAGIKDPIKYI